MNDIRRWSRRNFLYGVPLLTLLLSSCNQERRFFPGMKPIAASTPPGNVEPTGALSLAALQEHSKRNRNRSNSQAELLTGINRITGFLTDGSDVILFGHHDPALPGIELDAFVVALRNAFGAGDEYQGSPGCTIDPIPGDDPFRVQKVFVFGIPHDCLMAARYVNLDYELKRAGAGIPGDDGKILPSAFELADEAGPCSSSGDRALSMTHRFWFFPNTPAQPRFERDAQTVSILKPIGVKLLTEQEFLDHRGERMGATEADPAALRFAEAVTALLESARVARYSQMIHDFRVIEATKLMHFCGIPSEALSFLLHDYTLARVEVPRLVGGVYREEQGKTVCNTTVTQTATAVQYVESSSQYRYEYRGGVEARVELADADITPGTLDHLRHRVLDARPSSEIVSWGIA